jgi:hypothetical protein
MSKALGLSHAYALQYLAFGALDELGELPSIGIAT